MQPNKSSRSQTKIEVSQKPVTQDAEFWRQHFVAFQASGLNRTRYCLNQGLTYHRFGYWCHKFISEQASWVTQERAFLPVRLAAPQTPSAVLCTLEFGNHRRLLIHDEAALKILLDCVS